MRSLRHHAARGVLLITVATLAGCTQQAFILRDSDPAAALRIASGLQDDQVLQRDSGNLGGFVCEGTSQSTGELWARVVSIDPRASESTVVNWRHLGAVQGGAWKGGLDGIPMGGPYRVELQIRDAGGARVLEHTGVQRVYVGDLWILAGQSNMQGCGDMIDVEEPVPYVHTFESRYRWAVAEEPLHRLNESPNAVHHRIFNPKITAEEIEKARNAPRQPNPKGSGMGLPFARELYARTGVPIGLVPCAHGGTSMDQWDPARAGEGGNSLYGSMLDRFRAVGGKVKGVLWYQGESDASPGAQPAFRDKMTRFVAAVRKDFNDPALPFYMVQISRVTALALDVGAWCAIREDQRVLGETIPGVVTISAIDLDLDDLIHIGTQGLKRLGQRAAVIADRELFGNTKVTTGPRLVSVTVPDPRQGIVRVRFEGVNGSLRPAQHVAGFQLRTADGKPGPDFYDVFVDPKAPDTLVCQVWGELPPNLQLWYGHGLNPYCNLIDELDMAAPAFGPIPLTGPATQKAN